MLYISVMEELKNQIAELKAGRTLSQLKNEDKKTYYRVQGLSSKLSELKANNSGNFITKNDLTEYKNLIIFLMTKKSNYKGYLNLKEAMTTLLITVENENIVFKTKKSIKSIVCKLAISAGLENVERNLRDANGLTVMDNSFGNEILENFTQHRLSVLMSA